MLKKTDLLWCLAYPLYQICGTVRHEASHALGAWLEGATITKFVFWPTVSSHGFRWGYVQFRGPTSWLTLAAPYFADLLTFGLFFWLCLRLRFSRRWVWLNAVIIGLVSPLANTVFNYLGAARGANDVGRLLHSLPPFAVHAYLALTIVLYGLGLWVVSKRAPGWRQSV
jgi:hypothetical protein